MYIVNTFIGSFSSSGGDIFTDSLDNAVAAVPSLDPIYDYSVYIEDVNPALSRVEFCFSTALSPAQQAALALVVASYNGAPGFTGQAGSYLVANLPVRGFSVGDTLWAIDGRKVGEGPGSGTGVPVYWSGSDWLVFSTDSIVLT